MCALFQLSDSKSAGFTQTKSARLEFCRNGINGAVLIELYERAI